MKVVFLCIGKTTKSFLLEGELEYLKRLKHYVQLDYVVIPDVKNKSNLTVEQLKGKEGNEFISRMEKTDYLILLDENGKGMSSIDFSSFLKLKMMEGNKRIVFAVGGAFGFSEEMLELAKDKISLSKMTFSHQMVRMIFLEQLYRAFTIQKGEPYHHQ